MEASALSEAELKTCYLRNREMAFDVKRPASFLSLACKDMKINADGLINHNQAFVYIKIILLVHYKFTVLNTLQVICHNISNRLE